MYDSVISWFILVVGAVIGCYWFLVQVEKELEQNRKDNDDFFWEYEYEKRHFNDVNR